MEIMTLLNDEMMKEGLGLIFTLLIALGIYEVATNTERIGE